MLVLDEDLRAGAGSCSCSTKAVARQEPLINRDHRGQHRQLAGRHRTRGSERMSQITLEVILRTAAGAHRCRPAGRAHRSVMPRLLRPRGRGTPWRSPGRGCSADGRGARCSVGSPEPATLCSTRDRADRRSDPNLADRTDALAMLDVPPTRTARRMTGSSCAIS